MAWERKARGPSVGYYYRTVRVPDKPYPARIYFGRGARGQMAAAEGEKRRLERRRARDDLRAEREATAEAELLAAELGKWADVLSACWLILTNHHCHRGEWRLHNGKKT